MKFGDTRILLLRHGETTWNDGGRFQGHRDSPLTERGIAQVRGLARRLAGLELAALYSSDLGRAVRTAGFIADAAGLEVRQDARLRERCLGIFEGLSRSEMQDQFPAEAAKYYSGDPHYMVPEGESALGRFEIGLACLEEIAREHAGQMAAVVTHGGLVAGMFRHVQGIPWTVPRRFSVRNAAFNLLTHQEAKGWMIETWGDTSHYPEELEMALGHAPQAAVAATAV